MKKFFIYLKDKFLWILLFLFLSYLQFVAFFTAIDILGHSLDYLNSIPFSILDLLQVTCPNNYFNLLSCILIFIISNKFSLYVFSYKLYIGKNNWYKFGRELSRTEKKFEKELYKLYLDGKINIDDISSLNINFSLHHKFVNILEVQDEKIK